MKENLCFLLVLAATLFNNHADSQEVLFTTGQDVYSVNDRIVFVNSSRSSPADSIFIWNFGDDCQSGPVYSRKECNLKVFGHKNIMHTYSGAGSYTISLTSAGTGSRYNKKITIVAQEKPPSHRSLSRDWVKNTGFESCSAIPTDIGQLELSDDWFSPSAATPDLFHADFDTSIIMDFSAHIPDNFAGNAQAADSLKAYAGIISFITQDSLGRLADTTSYCHDYREYIQQLIARPLQRGVKYEASFYYRLASHSRYASKIGLCLSNGYIGADTTEPILANPIIFADTICDTARWHKASVTFIATGNESYLTIGNFSDDAHTYYSDVYPANQLKSIYGGFSAYVSYYYIDKVRLKKVSDYSLDRSTILSSGKTFTGNGFSLDYSIGQRVIATYCSENSGYCLTQGILQPINDSKENKNVSGSGDSTELKVGYYPNPTERFLNIVVDDKITSQINVVAYNIQGIKIAGFSGIKSGEPMQAFLADLNVLQSGTYIFRVYCGTKKSTFFKIVKI